MITPFTFIHAADLHLGTPFSGVGESSPAFGALLAEATMAAYQNLVELCIAEEAAFLVIAGDVYDGPERSIATLSRFMAGVRKLGEAGITVFVATGNHDPGSGRAWSALGTLPENLIIFPAKPASHRVLRDGETLAVVHGVGYHGKAVKEDLAGKFKRLGEGGFEIGVLHATVGSPSGHENYAPTTLNVLRDSGLDYWALGHVHTRTVLNDSHPVVAYPGNTQALSRREEGERGAYVVRVDQFSAATLEFRPLDTVRFLTLPVDLSEYEDRAGLFDLLTQKSLNLLENGGGRALILDLVLTGRTPLYKDLSKSGELSELAKSLCDELSTSLPPLWVNRIENQLAPKLDLDRIIESATIDGEVARKAQALSQNPELLETTLQALDQELFKKPEVKKLLSGVDLGEDANLDLSGAESLALDLLLGNGQ